MSHGDIYGPSMVADIDDCIADKPRTLSGTTGKTSHDTAYIRYDRIYQRPQSSLWLAVLVHCDLIRASVM